jgi:hypothetical protein
MGAANPVAAADLIVEIAKRRKLDIKVAAVTGDDVLKLMRPTDRVLETGGPLSAYKWLVSANAYLGCRRIAARAGDRGRTSSSPAASPIRRCFWRLPLMNMVGTPTISTAWRAAP